MRWATLSGASMSKEALDAWMAKYPRTGAVSDELVDAVSRVESKGDDYAVSSQGAIGPMQVIAGKQGLEPSDIANPTVNKQVGARILDKLHKQFGGDEERMLRAYNQGPGNERKREGNAPKETREYPGKVRAELAQWMKDHPPKSEWDDPNVKLPDINEPAMKQWQADHPIVEAFGKGIKSVMDFAEKNNPPVKMLFDATGARSVSKVADMVAYGDPLTTGKGQTLKVKDDVVDAALLAAPLAGKAMKLTKGLPVGLSMEDKGSTFAGVRSLLQDLPKAKISELEHTPDKLPSVKRKVESNPAVVQYIQDPYPVNTLLRYGEDSPQHKVSLASASERYDSSEFGGDLAPSAFARELDRVTSTPSSFDTDLYRGLKLNDKDVEAILNGATVSGQGMGSFSANPTVAHRFADRSYGKTKVVARIPKNTSVMGETLPGLNYMQREEEVLLNPKNAFKAVPKYDEESKTLLLDLIPVDKKDAKNTVNIFSITGAAAPVGYNAVNEEPSK